MPALKTINTSRVPPNFILHMSQVIGCVGLRSHRTVSVDGSEFLVHGINDHLRNIRGNESGNASLERPCSAQAFLALCHLCNFLLEDSTVVVTVFQIAFISVSKSSVVFAESFNGFRVYPQS